MFRRILVIASLQMILFLVVSSLTILVVSTYRVHRNLDPLEGNEYLRTVRVDLLGSTLTKVSAPRVNSAWTKAIKVDSFPFGEKVYFASKTGTIAKTGDYQWEISRINWGQTSVAKIFSSGEIGLFPMIDGVIVNGNNNLIFINDNKETQEWTKGFSWAYMETPTDNDNPYMKIGDQDFYSVADLIANSESAIRNNLRKR